MGQKNFRKIKGCCYIQLWDRTFQKKLKDVAISNYEIENVYTYVW